MKLNINQKAQMMKLWKDTFQDKDSYIKLIFDNYYCPELIETEYIKGQLVAGMLGVPYFFTLPNGKQLKALYLCGLATDRKYRGKGIMRNLIESINQKAKMLNYDFSFLIPANEGLRKYYRDRGYVDSFYRQLWSYSSVHKFADIELLNGGIIEGNKLTSEILSEFTLSNYDFSNEVLINFIQEIILNKCHKIFRIKENKSNNLNKELIIFDKTKCQTTDFEELNNIKSKIIDSDNKVLLTKIIEFLTNTEKVNSKMSIHHSREDWLIVIVEYIMSSGIIIYTEEEDKNIDSVLFCKEQNCKNIIYVESLYYKNNSCRNNILEILKKYKQDYSISIYDPQFKNYTNELKDSFYFGAELETSTSELLRSEPEVVMGADWVSYGMLKILNFTKILKFSTNDSNSLKYSILTEYGKTAILYENCTEMSRISEIEMMELLCRKPILGKDYVNDAFDLNVFNPQISLLLE